MGGALLWVKSHHSFLHGASSPEELVDRAAELGWEALALTDRHGVYGMVRAHVRASERPEGIRLIPGPSWRWSWATWSLGWCSTREAGAGGRAFVGSSPGATLAAPRGRPG